MIVKLGESRQLRYTAGTFNGVNITAKLFANAANTQLGPVDWNPSTVQVKVTFKRQKQTYFPLSDNLQILGHFMSLMKGQFYFYNGLDMVYPAAGVNNIRLHSVLLHWGGPLRVNMSDEVLVEVSVPSSGTFSANVNTNTSYVEFDLAPCVGYELGIPQTKSEVVQENITKQTFMAGDLVTQLALLNFDKDNYNNNVAQTLNLSSDRYELNLNYEQLILNHLQQQGFVPNMRYSTALPWSSGTAAFRAIDFYPQSFYIFGGKSAAVQKNGSGYLNKCKLDVAFNGPQVNPSQNYFVAQYLISSKDIVAEAARKADKHQKENYSELPKTVSGADFRTNM